MYSKRHFSYGIELELGDVDRRLPLPSDLGSWSVNEYEIINLKEPYRLQASDPSGQRHTYGGEINVYPSKTPEGLINRIDKIFSYIRKNGFEPTVSQVQLFHVHTGVSGLQYDPDSIRKLYRYTRKWQELFTQTTFQFVRHSEMDDWTVDFMLRDGTHKIRDVEFEKLEDVKKFPTVPILDRPAINLYHLKYGTIEFRPFNSTLNLEYIRNSLDFCTEFTLDGLNEQRGLDVILNEREWKFAPFQYNHEEYTAWRATSPKFEKPGFFWEEKHKRFLPARD